MRRSKKRENYVYAKLSEAEKPKLPDSETLRMLSVETTTAITSPWSMAIEAFAELELYR